MEDSKLEKLMHAVRAAEENMMHALERQYPKGSSVEVILHFNQVTPTKGVVVSHSGQGYVRVRISSAKENSRRSCRHVFFEQVYPGI